MSDAQPTEGKANTVTDGPAASPGSTPRRYSKSRMEAFSDGVFAFAITLLVLDIVIPRGAGDRDLLGAFLDQWPQYLAYIVSFATIGAIWLAHNAISELLTHVDSTYIRLNLLLLLFVAFTPFPTRFLSEYIQVEHAERVAVAIYGIAFLVLTLVTVGLWFYALRAGLVPAEVRDGETSANTQRLPIGIAIYVALIIIGLFWPIVAVFGYLALALYFIVPFRFRRRRRRTGAVAVEC